MVLVVGSGWIAQWWSGEAVRSWLCPFQVGWRLGWGCLESAPQDLSPQDLPVQLLLPSWGHKRNKSTTLAIAHTLLGVVPWRTGNRVKGSRKGGVGKGVLGVCCKVVREGLSDERTFAHRGDTWGRAVQEQHVQRP